MQITCITPLYPPGAHVGAFVANHLYMKGLAERGHLVRVIPVADRPGRRYDLDGVQVWPSKYRNSAIDHADVVISNLGDSGLAHRMAIEMGIPSVRMVHGAPYNLNQLNGAVLAVCNSQATADAIGRSRVDKVVCHPPTERERYETTPGDRVTLVNLSPEKGGEVFWHLARNMPKVSFLGVKGGYGSRQLVQKGFRNVEVINSTPHMRDEVYARTKVLLMPSRSEAWGMVAVEAMCSGIPVLARSTSGLRECLGGAGTVIDSYRIDRWQRALAHLLTPEGWTTASRRARTRALSLDPTESVNRFCDAIEGITS